MTSCSRLALIVCVPLVFVAGAAAPSAQQAAVKTGAALKSQMHANFAYVRLIEHAVIRGDIDEARKPAQWLAKEGVAGLPASAATVAAAVTSAGEAVAAAPDIQGAASGAASLVAACGTCHTAMKVSPRLPPQHVIKTKGGRPAHMAAHQQAVELLYRGLAAPSDADWAKGAAQLKTAALGGSAMPEVSKEAVAAEAAVHQLAERAASATDTATRVAVYGELIGSCASCHGLHGRVWGPGIRGKS